MAEDGAQADEEGSGSSYGGEGLSTAGDKGANEGRFSHENQRIKGSKKLSGEKKGATYSSHNYGQDHLASSDNIEIDSAYKKASVQSSKNVEKSEENKRFDRKALGIKSGDRVKLHRVVEVNGKIVNEGMEEFNHDDPKVCEYMDCKGEEDNDKEKGADSEGQNEDSEGQYEDSEGQYEDNKGQDEDNKGQDEEIQGEDEDSEGNGENSEEQDEDSQGQDEDSQGQDEDNEELEENNEGQDEDSGSTEEEDEGQDEDSGSTEEEDT